MLWIVIIILVIYIMCLKMVISHQEDIIDWKDQRINVLESETKQEINHV